MAIKEFLHISICVSDADRSVPFYRDILGFELVRETRWASPGANKVMDAGDSEFTTYLMTNGAYRLELIHYDRPKSSPLAHAPKMNSLGLSHLTVGVDDARKTMRELKAKGVKVLDHTLGAFFEHEHETMFLFEDPDGFLVEAYTVRPDGNLPYGG